MTATVPRLTKRPWPVGKICTSGCAITMEHIGHSPRNQQGVPQRRLAAAPAVDDIVSSGRAVVETLGHLRRLSLRPATCVTLHAVFADDAYAKLPAAGAARVVGTDSIVHSSKATSAASLLVVTGSELFGFSQGGSMKLAQP